jgi:hypothetical protein
MKFRITNADTSAVTAYLQKLSPAKEYDVTVAVHKAQRSIPQNKLYWCWVALICEETGADRDEVHTELKRRYLPSESVVGLYGEVIKRPISTSKLNTAQFTAYLEKVQVLASSELGIVLPVPEDRIFEEFYEQYENRI